MNRLWRTMNRVMYEVVLKKLPNSMVPISGRTYKVLRGLAVKNFIKHCGNNVNIEHGASLSSKMSIGNNSGVGINCSCGGAITIGDNVMMGPECVILTYNHMFDRTDIPMCEQGFQEERPVIIGNDVWIGRRVIILPGVHIGNGVIIGAGAVVTKDIPDWAVVAGNPATIKRYRK